MPDWKPNNVCNGHLFLTPDPLKTLCREAQKEAAHLCQLPAAPYYKDNSRVKLELKASLSNVAQGDANYRTVMNV